MGYYYCFNYHPFHDDDEHYDSDYDVVVMTASVLISFIGLSICLFICSGMLIAYRICFYVKAEGHPGLSARLNLDVLCALGLKRFAMFPVD